MVEPGWPGSQDQRPNGCTSLLFLTKARHELSPCRLDLCLGTEAAHSQMVRLWVLSSSCPIPIFICHEGLCWTFFCPSRPTLHLSPSSFVPWGGPLWTTLTGSLDLRPWWEMKKLEELRSGIYSLAISQPGHCGLAMFLVKGHNSH